MHKILILPGDGIGPEVVKVAVRILKDCAAEFGHRFEFAEFPFGGCAIDATGMPLPPETLAACRAADAILLVTPEYNYSIPGVLKNAIDWASRPYGDSSWEGKPVAVMGASGGVLGTARAQYHLRQVFIFLNMYSINRPEVMIGNAAQRFDPQGNLTDENSRKLIRQLIENLATWTRQLRQGGVIQ